MPASCCSRWPHALGCGLVAGLLPALQLVNRQHGQRTARRRPATAGRTQWPAAAPGTRGRRDRARRDAARRIGPADSQLRARTVDGSRIRFTRTSCCCRSTCRPATTTAEDGGVLHRSHATDSRAAGRRGGGRDQRLLHPPAAGLPHCARGSAAATAHRIPRRRSPKTTSCPATSRRCASRCCAAGCSKIATSHPNAAAGRRDQRGDGTTVLAGRRSYRQAAQVRPRPGREHAVEDRGRRGRRHAAAAARRAGDSVHVPARCPARRWTSRSATAGDPEPLRDAIRAQMRALDPSGTALRHRHRRAAPRQTVALRRFQTMLLVALAAVALMLVGHRRVRHHPQVGRRSYAGDRHPHGARRDARRRAAHGAGRRDCGSPWRGSRLGCSGSMALSRTIASFLYETSPFDPLIYAVGLDRAAWRHGRWRS